MHTFLISKLRYHFAQGEIQILPLSNSFHLRDKFWISFAHGKIVSCQECQFVESYVPSHKAAGFVLNATRVTCPMSQGKPLTQIRQF